MSQVVVGECMKLIIYSDDFVVNISGFIDDVIDILQQVVDVFVMFNEKIVAFYEWIEWEFCN